MNNVVAAHRKADYTTYHDLVTSKIGGVTIGEDVDRLRAAREALADFRSAVEQSQPNSRVRKLGLSWKTSHKQIHLGCPMAPD